MEQRGLCAEYPYCSATWGWMCTHLIFCIRTSQKVHCATLSLYLRLCVCVALFVHPAIIYVAVLSFFCMHANTCCLLAMARITIMVCAGADILYAYQYE